MKVKRMGITEILVGFGYFLLSNMIKPSESICKQSSQVKLQQENNTKHFIKIYASEKEVR